MRTLLLLALLLPLPAAAQHSHGQHGQGQHGQGQHDRHAAPYAGMQSREAAALGAEDIADLRAARGMGLALPAELNGYPGPLHVLEHAQALRLTPAQHARMTELMTEMRAAATPLGEALIQAERALDAVFASGAATPARVEAATEHAALARARLRAAHLLVHLATRDALSEAQRAAYARARGYVAN